MPELVTSSSNVGTEGRAGDWGRSPGSVMAAEGRGVADVDAVSDKPDEGVVGGVDEVTLIFSDKAPFVDVELDTAEDEATD